MKYLDTLNDKMSRFFSKNISNKQAYVIFLVLACLFVLPIIYANVDYIDDNARRFGGYYEWGSLGRFATEGLMKFLTFSGGTMSDMGIQLQVLAIPVLAFAGFLFTRSLAKLRGKVSIGQILAGAFIVLNPLLLTNLSFRYDSLSMMIAYCLAIYAATIVTDKFDWKRSLLVIGLIVLAAGLYQPMITVFITVSLVLYLYDYANDNRKDIMKRLMYAATLFFAGCATYFAIIRLFKFSNIGGESRGSIVPFSIDGLEQVYRNLTAGYDILALFFRNGWGKLLLLTFVSVLILSFVLILVKTLRRAKWYASVVAILVPFVMALSIMGPFVLMESTITAQTRTLAAAIGLVVLCATMILCVVQIGYRRLAILLVVPVVGLLYTLNFGNVYASALKNQREYDAVVYDEIDDYVLNSPDIQNAKVVYLGGVAASPKVVKAQFLKRPALQRMDISGDNSQWYLWSSLRDQGALANIQWYVYSKEQEMSRSETCSLEESGRIHQNPYYSIYKNGDAYFIWLTDSDSPDKNTFCTTKRL
ncbi:MAG: hypothetical protein EOO17_00375 [Chloroflexi bacterium]|nr:MAG: hypothetical protein EOO17_00375 [Chloroflexota bacterium]